MQEWEWQCSAQVCSFSFHAVSLFLLPPSLPSSLAHSLWSSGRRHCCLGVIMCSRRAIAQQSLLHILSDKCTCNRTSTDRRHRWTQTDNRHTDKHGKEHLTASKVQLLKGGCEKKEVKQNDTSDMERWVLKGQLTPESKMDIFPLTL